MRKVLLLLLSALLLWPAPAQADDASSPIFDLTGDLSAQEKADLTAVFDNAYSVYGFKTVLEVIPEVSEEAAENYSQKRAKEFNVVDEGPNMGLYMLLVKDTRRSRSYGNPDYRSYRYYHVYLVLGGHIAAAVPRETVNTILEKISKPKESNSYRLVVDTVARLGYSYTHDGEVQLPEDKSGLALGVLLGGTVGILALLGGGYACSDWLARRRSKKTAAEPLAVTHTAL